MRVGATSKSPTPASEGVAKVPARAAATAAGTILLFQTDMTAIPTLLRSGAITAVLCSRMVYFQSTMNRRAYW
jgi:hypothetical protein